MSAIALYARSTEGFDERVAHAVAVLQSAAAEHAGRIVQATSLGAEDLVITDLIARHGLPIAVATLETGQLHSQTLALIPWRRDSTASASWPSGSSAVRPIAVSRTRPRVRACSRTSSACWRASRWQSSAV